MSNRKANPMIFDHVKMASRQHFASKYMLFLPAKKELRKELERECALVVREQRARYGELFVDLPLAYDRPMRDRCGKCDLCLKACPTNAFVGPYVLDARRCISYLTIELKGWMPRHLRPLVGNHIFGCDICQEVCPYNVKARETAEAAFGPRASLYAPQLIPLLSLTEEEFRQRFRASPILRAKRHGFLRNVAVALGNIGSVEAVPALILALDDDEPLVRGHVAWALGQIGSALGVEALQCRLQLETDPEVRGEIDAAMNRLRDDTRAEQRD